MQLAPFDASRVGGPRARPRHHLTLDHSHFQSRYGVVYPMSSYSSGINSSFDPALLFSEHDFIQPSAPQSYSDDIAALQECADETIARKTRDGIVIQHRAWPAADAFRSEGDFSIGTRCLRRHLSLTKPARHAPQRLPKATHQALVD